MQSFPRPTVALFSPLTRILLQQRLKSTRSGRTKRRLLSLSSPFISRLILLSFPHTHTHTTGFAQHLRVVQLTLILASLPNTPATATICCCGALRCSPSFLFFFSVKRCLLSTELPALLQQSDGSVERDQRNDHQLHKRCSDPSDSHPALNLVTAT